MPSLHSSFLTAWRANHRLWSALCTAACAIHRSSARRAFCCQPNPAGPAAYPRHTTATRCGEPYSDRLQSIVSPQLRLALLTRVSQPPAAWLQHCGTGATRSRSARTGSARGGLHASSAPPRAGRQSVSGQSAHWHCFKVTRPHLHKHVHLCLG